MKDNMILGKGKAFSLRVIKLFNYLKDNKREFVISNQILRSGTSIGANIAESHYAASKPDFINKLNIALKEASETKYWLELLHEANYIDKTEFVSMETDVKELLKLLTASLKTLKAE
ncbi:MAG: four helix bundle protein [Firmicutes bacterium]|nr:four helix bundle protein [Bacillota bacterium]